MKNTLSLQLIKELFKPNDNDKHVEPFFYEDENGVHLRPSAEIQRKKYTADDFFTTAAELADAAAYKTMKIYQNKEEKNRELKYSVDLYKLAAEVADVAYLIS